MMGSIVIGYLSYLTQKNSHLRFDDFTKSVESLVLLKQYPILSVDNNSIAEAKEFLDSQSVFAHSFHYSRNFYDVALMYTTAWYAHEHNIPYLLYMYDDFLVYRDALEDVVGYMDSNTHIDAVRVTEFFFDEMDRYDADKVSKARNPDAVRLYNTATGKALRWSEPVVYRQSCFRSAEWHYTSRPTVWRTSTLLAALESLDDVPVLQGFESWAGGYFQARKLITGVLDEGMMRTTEIAKSARYVDRVDEQKVTIKKEELRAAYESLKTVRNHAR